MTQQIDFLPASYFRKRRDRKKRIWRRGAFAAFVVLIGLGVFRQSTSLRRLEASRDRLQERAARMYAELDSPEQLQQRVERLDARAELVTRLQLRTPPTRILAAIAESRPRFVSLSELRLTYDDVAGRPVRSGGDANASQPTDEPDRTPAQTDLETLKKNAEQTALFATVSGHAPDDVTVALFLSALQQTGVFDDAQLLFTDRDEIRGNPLRRFSIRLRVPKPSRSGTKPRHAEAVASVERGKGPRAAARGIEQPTRQHSQ